MLIAFLLFCVGVILLLVAGDILVRGAAALAHKWGVPSLIVGLTIVAFGTSAPELIVSVQSVLTGASELAIGNVIGSNIANILLVLGVPALIMALPTNVAGVGRNAAVVVLATVILIVLILLPGPLVMWHGVILFTGIVLYLAWMFTLARSGAKDPALSEMADMAGMEGMPKSYLTMIAFTLLGIAGLAFGGDLIVKNATEIAKHFDVSEAMIGLTIVAIGTSLPELATVMVASWRGHNEVAIGNILGSNIFNIFAVMGAASIVGNISIPKELMVLDIWVMLVATIALTIFILRRAPIGRKTGIVLLVAYALYMAAVASRFVAAG
ncbi:MAG: calcium/sodium antiporter [Robiginitomaculum sp.]|nr:calcium/sodium antiporter [Robiginitomaculum sp.]